MIHLEERDEDKLDISSIGFLQDSLIQITVDNFEHQIVSILSSKYVKSKKHMCQFLHTVDCVCLSRPLLVNLLTKLLSFLLDSIKAFFSSDELCFTLSHKRIILLLYEENIISIHSIIKKSFSDFELFYYFCKEIEVFDIKSYQKIIEENQWLKYRISNLKYDEFEQHRSKGVNDDPLALSIRNDDLDMFQAILEQTNLKIHSKIPFSLFETSSIVNFPEKMPTLIEYAAFFGSFSIFKYLWEKDPSQSSPRLAHFAIAGGNVKILNILEECKTTNIDENCVNTAIRFNRNDIVDYLHYRYNIDFSGTSFASTIKYHNFCCFEQILEELKILFDEKTGNGWNPLHFAAESNSCEIASFLINNSADVNSTTNHGIYIKKFHLTPLSIAICNGNYNIFLFLLSIKEIDLNIPDIEGILF